LLLQAKLVVYFFTSLLTVTPSIGIIINICYLLSPNEGYGDPGIWKTIPGYEKKISRGSFGQQNFLGLMYYEQLFLTAVDLITISVRFY